MTVLSRGARVRRGGRRPGWVLLTTLLVLAIGASSALVFTNRVELLKLAVILALWAAVAGAFVSVLYRRQAEADQAKVRDLKLVYDLQLDREISARREYELTVESQLRRELATELRGAAADEVAALRAELSSLRTSLEILFDADLQHRPALETVERDGARVLTDRGATHTQNGAQPPSRENPLADWVSSDRVNAVRPDDTAGRPDETTIIDVPEEPLLPPRQPAPPPEPVRMAYAPPPQQDPFYEPRHRPPAPPPPPPPVAASQPSGWQPVAAEGQWLPPGTPGSHWISADAGSPPPPQPTAPPSGRRRRYRDADPDDEVEPQLGDVDLRPEGAPQYGGRRSRSRHSSDYRDYGVAGLGGVSPAAPRLAPPPPPEPAPRHRSPEEAPQVPDEPEGRTSQTGGQSVADLMARLQVQPSGGGRRRRRDG